VKLALNCTHEVHSAGLESCGHLLSCRSSPSRLVRRSKVALGLAMAMPGGSASHSTAWRRHVRSGVALLPGAAVAGIPGPIALSEPPVACFGPGLAGPRVALAPAPAVARRAFASGRTLRLYVNAGAFVREGL
jgi:hypothetical protein